ncbi:MAG TPA: hypothetical protein DEF48_10155 [Nostoc sp. UBA8866]|nr:hypothetical protein DSM107007_26540 [Nostoc sp. PCC 7120 = FACHB-418]HBW30431.1 hypothetical protein [Nostoc sp. UBA8866]
MLLSLLSLKLIQEEVTCIQNETLLTITAKEVTHTLSEIILPITTKNRIIIITDTITLIIIGVTEIMGDGVYMGSINTALLTTTTAKLC